MMERQQESRLLISLHDNKRSYISYKKPNRREKRRGSWTNARMQSWVNERKAGNKNGQENFGRNRRARRNRRFDRDGTVRLHRLVWADSSVGSRDRCDTASRVFRMVSQ